MLLDRFNFTEISKPDLIPWTGCYPGATRQIPILLIADYTSFLYEPKTEKWVESWMHRVREMYA